MEFLKSDYGFALKSRQRETSEEIEDRIKTVYLLNKLSIGVAVAIVILFVIYIKHFLGNPYYVFPNLF